MTTTLAGIVLIGGFVLLMVLRTPVSFAMLAATLGSALVTGTNFSVMVRQMVDGANNFSLLSIPFFIVMGEFMSAGGISEKIVDLANLAVGRFRGGLAYVNVLDSMFFGGISGSAVADVSSLGTIVIPMMKKQGYDEDFAVGLTVTTACQGVLIPPSHNMVIYALAAGGGVSIGTLFMAGMLPGIVLGSGMIIMCMLMAGRYNFPKGTGVAKGQGLHVLMQGILPMMTLVIIMVGTGAGVFTATEASAIACVYTMFLAMVVFRSVKLRDVGRVIRNSLKSRFITHIYICRVVLQCTIAISFSFFSMAASSRSLASIRPEGESRTLAGSVFRANLRAISAFQPPWSQTCSHFRVSCLTAFFHTVLSMSSDTPSMAKSSFFCSFL